MKLSPAAKAWDTRKHNLALTSLKRSVPSKSRSSKGTVHQLNGHGVYQHQWFVPSTSDPRKVYKVSLTQDGVFMCDCPRFIFQKGHVTKHKPCNHIVAVKKGDVKFPRAG